MYTKILFLQKLITFNDLNMQEVNMLALFNSISTLSA